MEDNNRKGIISGALSEASRARLVYCRKLRSHEGLKFTQEEMAKQLGISRSHYSNIESGRRTLSTEELIKICKILNVSADFLLCLSDNVDNQILSVEACDMPYSDLDMVTDKDNFIEFSINYCPTDEIVRRLKVIESYLKNFSDQSK